MKKKLKDFFNLLEARPEVKASNVNAGEKFPDFAGLKFPL